MARRAGFVRGAMAASVLGVGGCAWVAGLGSAPSADPVVEAGAPDAGGSASDAAALDALAPGTDAASDARMVGHGHDSVRDELVEPCVEYGDLGATGDASTGERTEGSSDAADGAAAQGLPPVSVDLRRITTSAELKDAMGVSDGAIARRGTWATDPRAGFLAQHPMDDRTLRVALHVHVTGATEAIAARRLTTAARALLASDAGAFIARCGDELVSSTQATLDFYAVVDVATLNARERRDLAEEIDRVRVAMGNEADPARQLALASSSLSGSIGARTPDVWSTQRGGPGATSACTDLSCVFARATDAVHQAPDPLLDARPAAFQSYGDLMADASTASLVEARAGESAFVKALLAGRDLDGSLRAIVGHAAEYPGADVPALSTADQQVQSAIGSLQAQQLACYMDHASCSAAAAAVPKVQLPMRSDGRNLATNAGGSAAADDSGFEQQADRYNLALPWQSFDDDAQGIAVAVDLNMGYAHSGRNEGVLYVANQDAGAVGGAAELAQVVTVPASTAFAAGAWIRGDGYAKAAFGAMSADGSQTLAEVPLDTQPSPGPYAYRTLAFQTGSSTAVRLYVKLWGSGANPTLTYLEVDDVTMFAWPAGQ